MGCSPPGCSVRGISPPGDWTHVSCISYSVSCFFMMVYLRILNMVSCAKQNDSNNIDNYANKYWVLIGFINSFNAFNIPPLLSQPHREVKPLTQSHPATGASCFRAPNPLGYWGEEEGTAGDSCDGPMPSSTASWPSFPIVTLAICKFPSAGWGLTPQSCIQASIQDLLPAHPASLPSQSPGFRRKAIFYRAVETVAISLSCKTDWGRRGLNSYGYEV